jgi:hypothetical protein
VAGIANTYEQFDKIHVYVQYESQMLDLLSNNREERKSLRHTSPVVIHIMVLPLVVSDIPGSNWDGLFRFPRCNFILYLHSKIRNLRKSRQRVIWHALFNHGTFLFLRFVKPICSFFKFSPNLRPNFR